MWSVDDIDRSVMMDAEGEKLMWDPSVPWCYGTPEERALLKREFLARRTLRERLVDGFRRVWYGPDPEPLTNEEMRMIMCPREDEDDLPERVPPDDPGRLAWEAELRAMGVTPARKWSFAERTPRRRPSVWERIRYRISLGW